MSFFFVFFARVVLSQVIPKLFSLSSWKELRWSFFPACVTLLTHKFFESLKIWRVPKTHSTKYTPQNTKIHSLPCFSLALLTFNFASQLQEFVWHFPSASHNSLPSSMTAQCECLALQCDRVRRWGGLPPFPEVPPCNINGASLLDFSHHAKIFLNFFNFDAWHIVNCDCDYPI